LGGRGANPVHCHPVNLLLGLFLGLFLGLDGRHDGRLQCCSALVMCRPEEGEKDPGQGDGQAEAAPSFG
jgi:hypothetical protein